MYSLLDSTSRIFSTNADLTEIAEARKSAREIILEVTSAVRSAKAQSLMTSNPAKPHRLLLVEDNADDVFLFMRATSHNGQKLDVAVAGNAEEAIHALNGGMTKMVGGTLPDVVITDLKMPGWTGIHLVSWVRSQPEFRMLPIIVLSSSEERKDVINAYEAGATYYMVKPNNFQGYRDLVQQLENYCSNLSQPLQSPFVKTRGGDSA